MTQGAESPRDALAMRGLVEVELARAARANTIARRHELKAVSAIESMRPFHQRMAATHRASEARHRAAAAMHAYYADRLQLWAEGGTEILTTPPTFMAAVAEASGARSTAITLFGPPTGIDSGMTVVAASDPIARAAQDLEYILGEGPSLTVLSGSAEVSLSGEALARSWSQFGPAVRELGVHTVVAARLGGAEAPLGAVTTFRPELEAADGAASSLRAVAEALTATVLLTDASATGDDGVPDHPLFDDVDLMTVVHQAAGVVMTTHDCDLSDALALLRAHAFAQNEPVSAVARAVIDRTVILS